MQLVGPIQRAPKAENGLPKTSGQRLCREDLGLVYSSIHASSPSVVAEHCFLLSELLHLCQVTSGFVAIQQLAESPGQHSQAFCCLPWTLE